jgi:hypothetical protein
VLTAGNNANGIGIVELPYIHINDVNDSSVIQQSGIILAIQSGGDPSFGGTNNSILSLQVTDAVGADYEAINITDTLVTVNPALDVTSIVFPDTSTQISAPRFYETISATVDVPLTTGVSVNILSTTALPVGSFILSGYLQNTLTGNPATDMVCQTSLTDGTQFYFPSFTANQSQASNYVPTIPLNTVFRNYTAGGIFTLSQLTYWAGTGALTQTTVSIDVFYLGDN